MQQIADHIHSMMPRYNSVSFRLIDEANPGMMILGPYTGSFTPQLRIAFGQGLCGMAAATEKTIVANNVQADSRYIQGSSMVKSEIVVPYFHARKIRRGSRYSELLCRHIQRSQRSFLSGVLCRRGGKIHGKPFPEGLTEAILQAWTAREVENWLLGQSNFASFAAQSFNSCRALQDRRIFGPSMADK
jgi:hypothetical protein